jgi:transposase
MKIGSLAAMWVKVGNNIAGFKKIIEHTGTQYHFVMEATGVYYIRLAFYLNEQGCVQSVVNALAIKRYIQMHLERNKSDKKDAMWICKFGIDQNPPYWQMPDNAYFESKQLYNTIREYTEQIKRFNVGCSLLFIEFCYLSVSISNNATFRFRF